MSRITLLLFLVITIAAAIFRATFIELIEFKDDEAVNLFLASRPLFGHQFTPGSTISSVGILNPPLINYILFPLTLLSRDPKILSLFIGLINSLAIGFLFLILRRYYGLLVAFIATVLLAFSPWSILFSRKIWPQDFILLLLIPWLFSLHKLLVDNKPRYWAIYTASSLFLIQLHLPSAFFILLATVLLLIHKTSLRWKYLLIGLIVGILPLLPYVNYQRENNCPDCTAFAASSQRLQTYNTDVLMRPLQIMSQGNFHFILGNDVATFAQNYPDVYQARKLFYIEYLLLPIGMLLFWKAYPKRRLIIYLTILVPIAYFVLKIVPHMHYFIVLTPLLFLFLAFVFAKLITSKMAVVQYSSISVFILLIAVSIGFNVSFFDLLNQQKGLQGDYGQAFVVREQEVKKRFEKYEGDNVYQEMFLASFMPRSFVHADSPGAKMLYDRAVTEKSLPVLEQRLSQVPEDARIQLELIAYYTKTPITPETLQMLEEKTKTIPGYKLVFEEVSIVHQKELHDK